MAPATDGSRGRNATPPGAPAKTLLARFTKRDLALYALGIGCADDGDGGELRFVYERHPRFAPFPTFPLALSFTAEPEGSPSLFGFGVRPFPPESMANGDGGLLPNEFLKGHSDAEAVRKLLILHVSQSLVLHDDIQLQTHPGGAIDPPTQMQVQTAIVSIQPRNVGTFVTSETKYYQGQEAAHGADHRICVATARMVALILGLDPHDVVPLKSATGNRNETGSKKTPQQRQEGSFRRHMPTAVDRTKDKGRTVLRYLIPQNAALLYRLSGDYNPIHVEGHLLSSESRNSADGPRRGSAVLHGLCTMGYAVRAVLRHAGRRRANQRREGDIGLKAVHCNFVKPVYAGDRLRVDVWDEKDGPRHEEAGFEVRFRVNREVGRACAGGNPRDTNEGSELVVDKGRAHFGRKRRTAESVGDISRL